MVTRPGGHEAKPALCFPAHSSHAAAARSGLVALFLFLVAVPVAADPVTLEGVTFSDESGGSPFFRSPEPEAWPTPLS